MCKLVQTAYLTELQTIKAIYPYTQHPWLPFQLLGNNLGESICTRGHI